MISTEGIVLKQIKTGEDRRIVVLFTEKLGKISAGSNTTYHMKSKSSAILHPFSYGKYTLYKGKGIFNINYGETIKSFYKIGENIEKYAYCSYILEFTERILAENQRDPYLFELLVDFLEIIENRNKKYLPIIRAYEIKSLIHLGMIPQLNECVRCGNKEIGVSFSIEEGGLICKECYNNNMLIYNLSHSIIEVMNYIINNPIKKLEKLFIDDKVIELLNAFMKRYLEYHLDLEKMKSIDFINACSISD